MMTRAPTFGSQSPAPVAQCVPLPFPVVFTHISEFFIMNVPVRMSVPWPRFVAWADALLVIVALPSRKTVPRTVSFFVLLFHESSPARDLHEYVTFGVRSIAALPVGVALLFRSRSGPDAVSKPLGKTAAGSEPFVQGASGPRSAVRYASPMLLRAASSGAREGWKVYGAQQVSFGTKSRKLGGIVLPWVVAQIWSVAPHTHACRVWLFAFVEHWPWMYISPRSFAGLPLPLTCPALLAFCSS